MSRKVTRREFVSKALKGAALTGAALTGAAITSAANTSASIPDPANGDTGLTPLEPPVRPNILFILADDLGYGDLSCYGRPDYQTPHLDRLAAQGVRFANAYSAAPLCTPTRCAFITGRYPARTLVGLEEPLTERGDLGEKVKTLGLPPEHPTVASLLKESGYHTALIGKWHLGYLPNFGPVQSGFEEFFGIMSGAADFFTHKDMRGDGDLYEGKVPVERIGYTTNMLTERAVDYIAKHRSSPEPFYLSLHYTAPHWPWEGPRDLEVSRKLGRGYAGFTSGGSLKTYAAMMKSLDDGIGEVLGALDRSGLARNTLVIFTSDNGGERFSYNWPFRGEKFWLWEGGIRVPAIVRVPLTMSKVQRPMSDVAGSASAGSRIVHNTAITMDWTATILAAAQTTADPKYPLDGIDLMPAIQSSPMLAASPRSRVSASPVRTFFWRTSLQDAVLQGRWKYLRDGKDEYLFDLSVDEREQANFREQNPKMFDQLRDEFKKWNATVLPRPAARVR
jgi:arylsulfatase A-like enzyme